MEIKRLVWIDVLNIIACAGVLLLHCTNDQVHGFSGTPSADWFIGLTTHSFFLWPVNVFFMISGFTLTSHLALTDYNNWGGVKRFYNRRMKRLAIPLLAWNVVYMLQYFAKCHINGEVMQSATELLRRFVLFDFNGFMWFFVPLLLIYLSIPFFSVFVLSSDRQLLRLFLIFGLALSWMPPISGEFSTRSGLSDFYLMGSRFLYFIVAGYYIGHFDISRRTRIRLYWCTAASVVMMFVGTMCLTLYTPEHYKYFLSYTNLPCTITAMGMFTFFKYHNWDKTLAVLRLKAANAARYSSFSLGIYLIQGVWFTVTDHLHICDGNMLLKFLLMYFLCVASVWMMKHIPILKRIV